MTVDEQPSTPTTDFNPLAGGSVTEIRAPLSEPEHTVLRALLRSGFAPDARCRDVESPMFCGAQRVDVVW